MTDAIPPAGNEPTQKDQGEYVLPAVWLIILLAMPAILGAVLLGLYVCQFSRGLSQRQDTWGQFGDFIGGVLNPFITWMTLIAVAVSLRFTVHTLRETAKATHIALRQYENEIFQQGNRRRETLDAEKKERTFRMHQIWIDPGMQEMRRKALAFLQASALTRGTGGEVCMGRFRTSDSANEQASYNALRGIWEFLANVNTLSEFGLLDNWLAFHLFGASLEPWIALNNRVRLWAVANDTRQENLDDDSWFQGSVRPLGEKLRTWRKFGGTDTSVEGNNVAR